MALVVHYLQNICLFLSTYSVAHSDWEQTAKEAFLEVDSRLRKLLNLSVYWYRYIQNSTTPSFQNCELEFHI